MTAPGPDFTTAEQQVARVTTGPNDIDRSGVLVSNLAQRYCCVVIPNHEPSGLLPVGVHPAEWPEIDLRFATTPWREQLFDGFRRACRALADAGCRQVWLDGSFVTTKDVPGDFDGCWDPSGVDPSALDPVLLRFENGRAAQKIKYLGELFPAAWPAAAGGPAFVEFFQLDMTTGNHKGILLVDPRRA